MAGVTPTSVTPTSFHSFEGSHLDTGKGQSKQLDQDLEKHLGSIQGKHKPESKNAHDSKDHAAGSQHKPASTSHDQGPAGKHDQHRHKPAQHPAASR